MEYGAFLLPYSLLPTPVFSPRNGCFQQVRRNLKGLRYGLPVMLGNGDQDVVRAGVLRVEVEAQGGI